MSALHVFHGRQEAINKGSCACGKNNKCDGTQFHILFFRRVTNCLRGMSIMVSVLLRQKRDSVVSKGQWPNHLVKIGVLQRSKRLGRPNDQSSNQTQTLWVSPCHFGDQSSHYCGSTHATLGSTKPPWIAVFGSTKLSQVSVSSLIPLQKHAIKSHHPVL